MQMARDAQMLHGKLGRTLLGNYEGHIHIRWVQRAANAVIVGVIVTLPGLLLNWPQPLLYGLFAPFVLLSAMCFCLAIVHLFRWFVIAYGPPLPEHKDSRTPSKASQEQGDSSMQGTRELHPDDDGKE